MSKKNPRILSNTKLAVIGFLLILIPFLILSYLDYKAINNNTETTKKNYQITLDFLRDKIEREITDNEEKLSEQVNEIYSNLINIDSLKIWLSNVQKKNPLFTNVFILKKDSGIITDLISSDWQKPGIQIPQVSKEILNDYKAAENAEFNEKDFNKAIKLYNNALLNSDSDDSLLLLNRVARCYFYNQEYKEALNEYRQILTLNKAISKIGDLPPQVVALSQIAEIYTSTNQNKKYFETILTLYKWLLENPWDLGNGSYLFYVNTVSTDIKRNILNHKLNDSDDKEIKELKEKELSIHQQVKFINSIRQNILPEIDFSFYKQLSNKSRFQHLQYMEEDSVIQVGYFIIPSSTANEKPLSFGFIINKNYVVNNLLPDIFNEIDLGDNSVGLLNDKDSILYVSDIIKNQNYLIAENFLKLFTSWKIALFNREGKTITQLSSQEKQQSFLLFGLTILVMLIGITVIIMTTMHEHQVSKMKSYFVSNVSHELKTPISIIRMYSETLESGIVIDKNNQQEFYSIIKNESERLSYLINNILDFSKIESRKKEFNFEQTDIVGVVRNIINIYKPQIITEGFKLEVNIPRENILALIDKEAISSAVLNIMTNAVKYSNERKYICVEMYKSGNMLFITITDHGIGISKKEIKNIFNYFYRVPVSEARQVKGTGLGLTIVKYIIEAHRGSVSVESEVNKGSKFIIKIPCKD